MVRQTICFASGFIALTIFGTLSHEIGHVIVAKILGYDIAIYRASMEWDSEWKQQVLAQYDYFSRNPQISRSNQYLQDLAKLERHELMISLGGVGQTVLFGTFGFLMLLHRRAAKQFDRLHWFLIFLALFWSRQVFNAVKGLLSGLLTPGNPLFGGDEATISNLLMLRSGTFSIILGIIGASIVGFTTFVVVPKNYRAGFCVGAAIGCSLGYWIWIA